MTQLGAERAAVVTVLYNNSSTILALLDSLCAQQKCISRLVVVDNGSQDASAEIAEASLRRFSVPAVVIRQNNVGFARGVNAGVRLIPEGEPVLCVNPDVVLADGTIACLLHVLEQEPSTGIVTAPLLGEDGKPDSASIRRLPSLFGSILYGMLGRHTPQSFKYNHVRTASGVIDSVVSGVVPIEATTGALMLVNPRLIRGSTLFDESYWMYGEDLQLCFDAREQGMSVLMAACAPSHHSKGVSSGKPRRMRSDVAFYGAMWIYYRKNLSRGPIVDLVMGPAIVSRFIVSRISASLSRLVELAGRFIRKRPRKR